MFYVLEALADEALQEKNGEGARVAIRYLQDAIQHGATNPPTSKNWQSC